KNFGKQGLGTVSRPKFQPARENKNLSHQTHRCRTSVFGFLSDFVVRHSDLRLSTVVVTVVTAPINIGPSPPSPACKIRSCYDLENHQTLPNIDLLRPLPPFPLNSRPGGK